MTYAVIQREVVEFEIRRALDYYAVEAPEQVEKFLDALDGSISRIEATPTVPRIVRGRSRSSRLNGFPYSLMYVVIDEFQTIEITALVHDRQDKTGLLPRSM